MKKPERHLMVDLETFGTKPDSVIRSIGAVVFDPHEDRPIEPHEQLYLNVDLADAMREGLRLDPDTILWWTEQSEAAQKAFKHPVPISLKGALTRLWHFWSKQECFFAWSHGSNFDLVILQNAIDVTRDKPVQKGMSPYPWWFWACRDTRTLFELARYKPKYDRNGPQRTGTHHNALDDALYQVEQVRYCYKKLFQSR